MIPYIPPWKKKQFSLMGGYLGDRAGPGQNPFPGLTDPNWSGVPRASAPQYDYTMDASAGSKKKKFDFSKLDTFRQALEDLDPGPDATPLTGGKFGRGQPAPLGFSLTSMGGRLGEQEAMAKARREEELRRRMKLMGGGY